MEKLPTVNPKKHWYYIAWVAVLGVFFGGGMAEANIVGGEYNLLLYSVCGGSLLLAGYSIVRYKFGSLIELLLFLPRSSGGFDE